MRLSFAAAFCAALLMASPAFADSQVFILASQPDGYGIDECLASGASCGATAARMYCESRQFTQASAYHRLTPEDVTGTVPTAAAVRPGDSYIAITCQR